MSRTDMMGTHVLLEFRDGNRVQLNDLDHIRTILYKAAEHANMQVLKEASHKFEPHGLTALLLVAESHISVHTWPEFDSCAVDIFCCASKEKAMKAASIFKQEIKGVCNERIIER